MSLARAIPQPRPRPIVGNVPDVGMEHPVQSLVRLGRQYGPLYRVTFPGRTFLVASSRALVHELCDEERFDKKVHTPLWHIRDFAGDGLFTAQTDEPNWGRAHRILLPAFGPGAMRGYFDAMLDISEQLLTKWSRLPEREEIDVPDAMTRLTLDTIALCGFGYRFNSFYQREMHPFVDAMVRCLAEAGARGRRVRLQTQLMLGARRQYGKDIAFMNEVVDRVIRERRAQPTSRWPKDLLSLMLEGVDPVTGARLDDVNIRHQIVTFLIAGHETTSGLLSFTLHALTRHPKVLERARAEADRVLAAYPGRAPRYEELPRLRYLDQVLRESLRLWPTAPAFAVQPLEDTVLGGEWPVKAGEPILILTPLLHQDPEIWGPEPGRFDPERFSPDNAARLPENAWKPFGNGQRACIGRQFAMQEATLLLAMMLRRFELVADPGYQLRIKETLTLKPEGFTLKVRPRTDALTVVPQTPAPAAVVPAASRPVHGTPLCVLYGSNTGSSEAFARKLADEGRAQGYAVTVDAMDSCVDRLPPEGAVVVVTASYNGQPPDNARRFCAYLDRLSPGALSRLHFAVFGCGHKDWASTYQSVPKRVDAAFTAAGAVRLVDRGEADASGDYYGAFDAWLGSAWRRFGEALKVDVVDGEAGARFEVSRVPEPELPRVQSQGLSRAEVLENRELVDLRSPFGRSKRHLVLRLPEGIRYRAGDHVAVLPENPPEQVARVARRFQLALDGLVSVRRSAAPDASAEAPFFPLDVPLRARDLLSRYVELSSPATRRDLERLVRFTQCPPEKKHLERLLALDEVSFRREVTDKRVTVLELLEQVPACELPLGAFLDMAPPLRPRRYSVASSPLEDPSRCALTVAVVEGPAWSGMGRFEGACSSYLRRVRVGDRVAISVRSNPAFHLPEDPLVPLLLVGAGTGLAPLRGFLQERSALKRLGASLGKAFLFFGCDHPDVDFLYREELSSFEQEGVVEVLPAFFRAERDGVTFVQHRLWAERTRVRALLAGGASVYVCGDGRHMAPAVKETLLRVLGDEDGGAATAARRFAALEAAGRYRTDVFGG